MKRIVISTTIILTLIVIFTGVGIFYARGYRFDPTNPKTKEKEKEPITVEILTIDADKGLVNFKNIANQKMLVVAIYVVGLPVVAWLVWPVLRFILFGRKTGC